MRKPYVLDAHDILIFDILISLLGHFYHGSGL